jgi:hypothetical protein
VTALFSALHIIETQDRVIRIHFFVIIFPKSDQWPNEKEYAANVFLWENFNAICFQV